MIETESSEAVFLQEKYKDQPLPVGAAAAFLAEIEYLVDPEHELYELNSEQMFDQNPLFLTNPHGLIVAAVRYLREIPQSKLSKIYTQIRSETAVSEYDSALEELAELVVDETDPRSVAGATALKRMPRKKDKK